MPLVKIDIIRNVRTPEEIKKLADVVQEVMLEKFNAPAKDRYVGLINLHTTHIPILSPNLPFLITS
jgi:phenylpyruvate tautomerase PptA (4-oxalocrotonate tautomerase family)